MPAATPPNPMPQIDVRGKLAQSMDPATFDIMLVDDHESIRKVLEKALGAEGYRIRTAVDGVQLLEEVRRQPPDVVILDVMMPRLNGLEALAQIRMDPQLAQLYVLLLTSRSSLEDKVEGFEHGADDYLTKPFQLPELLARVRAGVRIRALARLVEESQQLIIRQEKLATVGQLASGVAHEFNNIMGAISGFAQLAKNNEKFLPRLAAVALEQAKRAQQITNSLSSFANSSAEGLRHVSVPHLVESAVLLVEKELSHRSATVRVEVAPDLPSMRLDSSQMQQAIVHLLLNASDAIPEQGEVSVRAYTRGDQLCIEVDDNGEGVPEEHRHRIFDPFFTTRGSASDASPGTGLGLSFSQNIAHRHSGVLKLVPSRLGGACFQMALPVKIKKEDESPEDLPQRVGVAQEGSQQPLEDPQVPSETLAGETSSRAPGTRGHVMILEDDPALQEILEDFLEDYDLAIFPDGPSAWEACQRQRPDVVILDQNLAGNWNGTQFLEHLCELDDPPPVILCSGSIEPQNSGTLPLAPTASLHKPYQLAELEDALQSALRESQLS